jgi:hypothetical protein
MNPNVPKVSNLRDVAFSWSSVFAKHPVKADPDQIFDRRYILRPSVTLLG